jgi:hypothetical protein
MSSPTKCPHCGRFIKAGLQSCPFCSTQLAHVTRTKSTAATNQADDNFTGVDYERKLGWNWLWFLPLCIAVLIFVEGYTVPFAWQLLKLGYRRWTWGALFSPSAYFFLSVLMVAVFSPLEGLLIVSAVVRAESYGLTGKRRYFYASAIIIFIFLVPLLTDALAWGSFPFTYDNHGDGRLRMIPFIPWPSGRFREY